jgi:hypothetical protein
MSAIVFSSAWCCYLFSIIICFCIIWFAVGRGRRLWEGERDGGTLIFLQFAWRQNERQTVVLEVEGQKGVPTL